MSVIGETGIGHGGCTSEKEYAEYEKHKSDPRPPSDQINLDPLIKEISHVNLTNREKILVKATIQETKDISVDRAEALAKEKIVLFQLNSQTDNSVLKHKSLDETKKLINTFREKVAIYPKYISYEGSMVLCVLISLNQSSNINLNGLPESDRNIILAMLSENAEKKITSKDSLLTVMFDESYDFVLHYWIKKTGATKPENIINLFNTVIHSNPNDNPTQYVPIENDGEKISLGGKITLDKKSMVEKIGIVPLKNKGVNNTITEEDIVTNRRQPTTGKNAFEIRSDILGYALEYIQDQKKTATTDEILYVAKKFYSFVENRSR